MDSRKGTKINKLLKIWPKRTVAVQSWLDQQRIYRQLADIYCQNDWMTRLSNGVYSRSGEHVEWTGGLYALQQEILMKIHVGAKSALEMSGLGQYVYLTHGGSVWLFIDAKEKRKLPVWFKRIFGSKNELNYVKTNLFTACNSLGLQTKKTGDFDILMSSPERAIMECMYLVPDMDLDAASTLMEKLRTLRPALVQELLECCSSIKVKRLFLYLAALHNHTWLQQVDLKNVNLGTGSRKIGEGGKFIAKYQLSVPAIKNEGYSNEEVKF